MLKIKDSTGKVIGVLKDEDNEPEMDEENIDEDCELCKEKDCEVSGQDHPEEEED